MSDRGQATVEVVGAIPLIVVALIALGWALAFGAARESARTAAHAAALAIEQEQDPVAAARAAVPDIPRRRLVVKVSGREVSATVKPATDVPGAVLLPDARAESHVGLR